VKDRVKQSSSPYLVPNTRQQQRLTPWCGGVWHTVRPTMLAGRQRPSWISNEMYVLVKLLCLPCLIFAMAASTFTSVSVTCLRMGSTGKGTNTIRRIFKEVGSTISSATLLLNHHRSLMMINRNRSPRLMSLPKLNTAKKCPSWPKKVKKNL
jgi:hypothetical protein